MHPTIVRALTGIHGLGRYQIPDMRGQEDLNTLFFSLPTMLTEIGRARTLLAERLGGSFVDPVWVRQAADVAQQYAAVAAKAENLYWLWREEHAPDLRRVEDARVDESKTNV
jgi:hypothetical protein